MSENATFQLLVDDAEGFILDEDYDYSQHRAHDSIRFYIFLCYFPLQIVVGLPCNIVILAILIRRRLWLRHEAYLYLAAILSIDSLKLIVFYGDFWMTLYGRGVIRLSVASDVVCKVWSLLAANCHTEWLHVLLLLNVCLRQQLTMRNDGRGCCTSLIAKYCTLFGTKVILGSYLTVCVVANYWSFASYGLQRFGESWYCYFVEGNSTRNMLFLESSWWLGMHVPLPVLTMQLLLIVWKRKRLSGFAFRRMNGDTPDDFDAEVLTRIAVGCSVATCITGASGFLSHILHLILKPKSRLVITVVTDVLQLIHFFQPLSTAVVCFAVKSRLRDDLKSIIGGCCYGSSFKILPSEPGNNDSSVLQMSLMEEDAQVRQGEDDSVVPIILQT